MKELHCSPEDAVEPYYLITGNVPVASPDGFTGLRFDTQPPTPFPLSSAADDGIAVSREEFLAACRALAA